MRRGISRAASSAAAPSSACCRTTRSTAAATAPTAPPYGTRWRRRAWRASHGCNWKRAGTRASSKCISSRGRNWSRPGCMPAWSPASSQSGNGVSPSRACRTMPAAPPWERRDAGLAAVRLLAMIDQEFPKVCGERSTWTCGRIAVEPGAPSIIPGKADILFQFRDIDVGRARADGAVPPRLRAGEQPTGADPTALMVNISKSLPAPCDPAMNGGARCGGRKAWRLASGSGCRAGQGTTRSTWPVPCRWRCCSARIGGISHHWAEDTKEEDLALSCRILGDAAGRFLAGRKASSGGEISPFAKPHPSFL